MGLLGGGRPCLPVCGAGCDEIGEQYGEIMVDSRSVVGAGRGMWSGVHGHRLNRPGGSRHCAYDAIAPNSSHTTRVAKPRPTGRTTLTPTSADAPSKAPRTQPL